MLSPQTLRLGTRGSALARWQTEHIATLLHTLKPDLRIEVEVIATQGDRVLDKPLPELGGKGIFTAELEAALRSGEIDIAVHSLKDLPTEAADGLTIAAIPERGNSSDVLISRHSSMLRTLAHGAIVGTSSQRRRAQLLHLRPDVQIRDLRGNVDTRLRKALDPSGGYDAIILAYAGLERLDRLAVVSQMLSLDDMLPAPGQGALAVQCRADFEALDFLALIQHAPSATCVAAERAFLAGLGSGCTLPVAAHAEVDADRLLLRGRVNSPDGAQQIDVHLVGDSAHAETLGYQLADRALARGAAALLESQG